jgi:uncharacterized protein
MHLMALVCVFFLTSVISVVTGSTSLVTVPVLIAFGIEAHTAVATNMLALTFMSVGGTLPFARSGTISRTYLPASIGLTAVGSVLGALALLAVPLHALQLIIAGAMIAVSIFILANKDLGLSPGDKQVSRRTVLAGYSAVFLLAVYGGFFSGGYATLLTVVLVVLFGMALLQAVATVRVLNIFSSAVATGIFLWRGMVDVGLGTILGIAMFFGAMLGGRIALKLSAVWLRRVFLIAVMALALRMIAVSLR